MSDSTSELYQSIILEHNRSPRNYRRMDDATGRAGGVNPVCGDEVVVFVNVVNDVIRDVSFQGSGCAVSRASASLMTHAVKGQSVVEARRLFSRVREWLTRAPEDGAGVDTAPSGQLAVLGGVRAFPLRVRCAMLPWHALNAALGQ